MSKEGVTASIADPEALEELEFVTAFEAACRATCPNKPTLEFDHVGYGEDKPAAVADVKKMPADVQRKLRAIRAFCSKHSCEEEDKSCKPGAALVFFEDDCKEVELRLEGGDEVIRLWRCPAKIAYGCFCRA